VLQKLSTLIRNNPDYFGAAVSSFGVMGLQSIVQILLVPFYLHSLGFYMFGVLSLLMSGVAVASLGLSWAYGSILRVMGTAGARGADREFAEGYAAARWLFDGCAITLSSVAVLAGVLLGPAVLADTPAELRSDVIATALLAVVHFVVLVDLSVDQMALSVSRRQTVAYSFLMIGILVFVALVVPWLLSGGGAAGVFACLIASNVVIRVCTFIHWRRSGLDLRWRWPVSAVATAMGRLIGEMRRGYLVYGLIAAALQTDVILVGALGGARMAAEFVLVWKIAEVLILVLWRLSENLQPELVHTHTHGDSVRLARIFARGSWLLRGAGILVGVAYAVAGPWVVRLWVGAEVAPDRPLAYALAGGAIAWLVAAKLHASFAYALGHVAPLQWVAGIELALKLALFLALFPFVDYLAPLIAINAVHVFGIAWAYTRLPRA
jgi:hypothetical protein